MATTTGRGAHSLAMTPARAGLLGLATAGTTGTVLLVRLFIRALESIDVEVVLDPYGRQPERSRGVAAR
jgi:hypothetical protein